jgi:hypothetical protein
MTPGDLSDEAAGEKWCRDYEAAEADLNYWSERIAALNRELHAAEYMATQASARVNALAR